MDLVFFPFLLLFAEFYLENRKLYLHLFILHVCWCPGNAENQGTTSHGIDLVISKI